MSEIAIGKGPLGSAVLTVLTHLKNGEIGDAIDCFAEEFRFKDHGIGLEFTEKSAWPNSSGKLGSFTQILRCRLTQFL